MWRWMRHPPAVLVICKPLPAAFGLLPRPFHKDRHKVLKYRAHLAGQIIAVFVRDRLVHIRGLAQLQLNDVYIVLGPAILPGDVTALEALVECRRIAVG